MSARHSLHQSGRKQSRSHRFSGFLHSQPTSLERTTAPCTPEFNPYPLWAENEATPPSRKHASLHLLVCARDTRNHVAKQLFEGLDGVVVRETALTRVWQDPEAAYRGDLVVALYGTPGGQVYPRSELQAVTEACQTDVLQKAYGEHGGVLPANAVVCVGSLARPPSAAAAAAAAAAECQVECTPGQLEQGSHGAREEERTHRTVTLLVSGLREQRAGVSEKMEDDYKRFAGDGLARDLFEWLLVTARETLRALPTGTEEATLAVTLPPMKSSGRAVLAASYGLALAWRVFQYPLSGAVLARWKPYTLLEGASAAVRQRQFTLCLLAGDYWAQGTAGERALSVDQVVVAADVLCTTAPSERLHNEAARALGATFRAVTSGMHRDRLLCALVARAPAMRLLAEACMRGEAHVHRPLDPDQLEVREPLGQGGSGTVYHCNYGGMPAAIKYYHRGAQGGGRAEHQFRAEIAYLSLLLSESESLVQCFGAYLPEVDGQWGRATGSALPTAALASSGGGEGATTERGTSLRANTLPRVVLEYVPHTLASAVQGREAGTTLPWSEVANYALQLARALDILHRQQIVHGDLKPANVMVNNHRCVKLIDFGVLGTVTTGYAAPELLRGDATQLPPADVYSFAVTMWSVASGGVHPYTGDELPLSGSDSSSELVEMVLLVDSLHSSDSPTRRAVWCASFSLLLLRSAHGVSPCVLLRG
jgi:Protein kinase domain